MKYSVVMPYWQDRPASENLEIAINADENGFSELWMGEMATFDAFAFATAVGLKTSNIALTIGPLAVSVRTPMTMAMGIASVAHLTGRQTSLALGTSSNVVVQEWHGRARARTSKHLGETAQIVRGLLSGDKVDFEGEMASCKGYRLRLDAASNPLTIAAFGPSAIRVAVRHGDRMLLNMVTPESTARLRQQMEEAARKQGRPAPKLAAWLACGVEPNRETIDQMLRAKVGYLAAPGYGEMFIEAGFGDLVKFARSRPHPKELLAAMPDELISASGLVGGESEIRKRLEDYRAAGLDEVCLVPATAGDAGGAQTLKRISEWLKVK